MSTSAYTEILLEDIEKLQAKLKAVEAELGEVHHTLNIVIEQGVPGAFYEGSAEHKITMKRDEALNKLAAVKTKLTLERKISTMLRKTLVKLKKEYNSQGKVFPATLSIALVREKVMRKSQLLNTKKFSSKLVGEENE